MVSVMAFYETRKEKLIRKEVVETNPEVQGFIKAHRNYEIKRKSFDPSLTDERLTALEKQLDDWPSSLVFLTERELTALQERRESVAPVGGQPGKWEKYEHPENLALFEVLGAPKCTDVKTGEWIYKYKTTYSQDLLKVYVDLAKKTVVDVAPLVRTYAENENVIPSTFQAPK